MKNPKITTVEGKTAHIVNFDNTVITVGLNRHQQIQLMKSVKNISQYLHNVYNI